MAGYFSNHSQSRFLANSSNGAQNASSTTTMTATANPSSTAPRPRVPSSKHFSTSVSTSSSGDEKPTHKEKQGVSTASNGTIAVTVHPLRNTYVQYIILITPSHFKSHELDGYFGFANNEHRGTKSPRQTTRRGSRRFHPSVL